MDVNRWRLLPLGEQMGHITSEISRALVWERKKDPLSRKKALERALELIDLTVECQRKLRRRELARLREMVSHCWANSPGYTVTLEALRRFGLPFARLLLVKRMSSF